MTRPTRTEAWSRLAEHRQTIEETPIRELFERDPRRVEDFSLELDDILVDFSKHRADRTTVERLVELARACDLEGQRDRMFAGAPINHTEDRAVLHTALRGALPRPVSVDGVDVGAEVTAALERMRAFCARVRGGDWTGHGGAPIRHIVQIGIGGSSLGPRMACEALRPYWSEDLEAHFVANIDGTHLAETLARVDLESTLFIVASKSFTTQETLRNARSARRRLVAHFDGDEDAVSSHFVAVSAHVERAESFGIEPDNVFPMWDWVGGRYSLWSAIGLPVALVCGMDRFEELLDGARRVDEHFREAPLERNIPVILGLLGIWYTDFFGAASHAVLPYDQYLRHLPAHLQQLDMESNGKRVDRDGDFVDDAYQTGPIVWGQPGTLGQHAFYQLVHQGTRLVPCDFLAPLRSHNPIGDHHEILLANLFAQAEALMLGKSVERARSEWEDRIDDPERLEEMARHRSFPGNRPSTTILFDRLDARTLGSIVALYEHRVFVQGAIWNINSFDQWGVELGKELAGAILPELSGEAEPGEHDASTAALIERARTRRADSE